MLYADSALPAWQCECYNTNRKAHLPPKEDHLRKKAPAASENSTHQGKHLQERTTIVSPQDSSNNTIKERLIADLQTAREELKRAKILLRAASVQAQTTEPENSDGVPALISATAEYDCALNQYLTAVDSFADMVLNHVSPEQ
jgi:hypothetical protein